jgi:hypothetical protein
MKTTIKYFALLFTASLLFSCQPEEVTPSDVQYVQQIQIPVEDTAKPDGNNSNTEHEKTQL